MLYNIRVTYHFQIYSIDMCKLKKHGDVQLPFAFVDGSCSTFDEIHNHRSKIYLCFGSSDATNRAERVPMEYVCYYNNADEV